MNALLVNTGSSSVRLTLWDKGPRRAVSLEAGKEPALAVRELLGETRPALVVHRVVHGGRRTAHARITPEVEHDIRAAAALAPLHNPKALAWIEASRAALPDAAHVAVFDTAYFAELPAVAATYALPQELARRHGLRRYGFHGLAHASLVRQTRAMCEGARRIVTLQLGGGCSATASFDGAPVDTSMGFSPSEGLMMATRAGDLDSGLLLHLMQAHGYDAATVDRLINRESGIAGVSGVSGDVREVLAAVKRSDPAAQLALELFCYRARKYVGAYAAVLGGLDALSFGGGIGEHAPEVRRRITAGLEYLGVTVDDGLDVVAVAPTCISTPTSRMKVLVLRPDEAAEMAEAAQTVRSS